MCSGVKHRAVPGQSLRPIWHAGIWTNRVQPKQLPEPGVVSAVSDEGDSGNEHDGNQTTHDATVRLVTLPEGFTVVLNSLRQVVYCHGKSDVTCVQMTDNPELLDGLKFEGGTSSGSGDLSQKRRTDCKRRLSDRSEHGKSKIIRDNHHPRSSQYVENQVMVKSPSCWIDPFQTNHDRRRTAELTSTSGPMLPDVIELKQAALWHGGKIRIDQASEAAAEGMVRLPKALRISFRPNEVRALSGTHQEHTKPLQTSYLASCISSPSAVELSQMSGGTCQEQSSTDASDSSMCGSNCASRLERASSTSRKISQGKSDFPLATIPAVDISRSHSFYRSVVSDDPGRHSGEDGADNRSTSIDTSLSWMCVNDATTTDGRLSRDFLRMQQVSLVQKSGAHISYYGITCFAFYAFMFCSSAHGEAGDDIRLRLNGIGRELYNVECSSRISYDPTGATILTGAASASFVFWNQGPGSTKGDRSNVSGQTAEGQGEQGSSDIAGHDAEDMNNTGLPQSVRVWTDKTDVNADIWEAAIRHFIRVSVSSCFMMEINKGCLQPSIFDDSIFGEYIGSLVKNAGGDWELAVKTNVSQNRCRVFRKCPWWDLSRDDDIWLCEQATMNRAQNSFVDEHLEQVQSTHDELRCYFADHKTMQIRPSTIYDLSDKSRTCILDIRDAPNCELEAIRQHVRNMKPYLLTAQYNDDNSNDESIRALCEQQANQGGYFLLNLRSCSKEQDPT